MQNKTEGYVLLHAMAYLEEHGPTNTRQIARAIKAPVDMVRRVLMEGREETK